MKYDKVLTDRKVWAIRDAGNKKNVIATAADPKLAEAILCLLERPRMIASITGGVLQTMILDDRISRYIDSYLVDYDTEGVSPEEDPDRCFYVSDSSDDHLVSVCEYPFDDYADDCDEALAVDALLDPKKRGKIPCFRREVKAVVLFSDGSWESHGVLVDQPHNWSDTVSWSRDAKPMILQSVRETNQVKGRTVLDIVNFTVGEKVEEITDAQMAEEKAEDGSGTGG